MSEEIKEKIDKSKENHRYNITSSREWFENLLDYITNLQQENKQLNKQLEYLRSNEYLNQVKWERNFNEELVKGLQQRIDKAIEYIKDNYLYYYDRLDDYELKMRYLDDISKLNEILGGKE